MRRQWIAIFLLLGQLAAPVWAQWSDEAQKCAETPDPNLAFDLCTRAIQSGALSGSGLAVTFTIDPSSSQVCLIWNGWVAFFGHGTCIIYANQPGNANYLPAPQVQQVIAVA